MSQVQSKLGQFFIFSFIIGVIGYLLIGNNFRADFGPIDDHGIFEYLGPDRRLTIQEIPQLIKKSEIGALGNYPRFRLLYTPLMILETYVWKDSAFLWYSAKYVLFILSFTIYWWIIRKYVGVIIGFLVVLFTLTFPFWGDIWTRLGTGELYAAFGISLYAFAYIGLLRKKNTPRRNNVYWTIFLLSSIIAIGSKENFVILLFPTLYLALRKIANKTLTVLGAIITAFCILFTLVTVYFTVIAVTKNVVDVYGNNTGILFRIQQAVTQSIYLFHRASSFGKNKLTALGILCIVILSYRFFKDKKYKYNYIYLLKHLFAGFFLLSLLLLSQLFFYSGIWPTSSRYDFPGMMAIPIGVILLYSSTKSFLERVRTKPRYIRLFTFATAAILIWWITVFRFPITGASRKNMEETRFFMSKIRMIAAVTSAAPAAPIVVESKNPMDFEMIFAIPVYLRYYGVHNPLFLKLDNEDNGRYTNLEKRLAHELAPVAVDGNMYYWAFTKFANGMSCFSVQLSGSPQSSCRQLTSFERYP